MQLQDSQYCIAFKINESFDYDDNLHLLSAIIDIQLLSLLGSAPADPCDSELRNKWLQNMNEEMNE